MAEPRRWQGFVGRINIPQNLAATQAFDTIHGFLRQKFGKGASEVERVLSYADVFARDNVAASGIQTGSPYLFHSLVGVPQPNPITGWYDCGALILDTGINDPASDAGRRRAVYAARVRPVQVEQTGAVGSNRAVRWLMTAQPFLGARPTIPAAAGVTQIPDDETRVYLKVQCWCDEQANGVNPTDLRLLAYSWELLSTG